MQIIDLPWFAGQEKTINNIVRGAYKMADWAKNLLFVAEKGTSKSDADNFFASIANEEVGLLIDFQNIIPVESDGNGQNWQDKRIEAWGTKCVYYFNQYKRDDFTIGFITAWTGVPRLMLELSRQHPKIEIGYICELEWRTVGSFAFKAGKILAADSYELGTESYDKFLGYLRSAVEESNNTDELSRVYALRSRASQDVYEVGERAFEELAQRCKAPLEITLDELNLTLRPYNCMKRAEIHTVEDIVALTEEELLNVRNFNEKCFVEVKNKLDKLGVQMKEVTNNNENAKGK